MELTSLLTTNDLLKLKCDSCKNFLSVFPICISEDKKNICGRCSGNLPEGSSSQYVAFETLAQIIKFPCRYNHEGCLENFTPKDMAFHERACNFRTIQCPTSRFTKIECNWKGFQTNSTDHCLNKHSDLIWKQSDFDFLSTESYERANLLEHNSLLFVVEQKYDSLKKLMVLSIYNHKFEFDFKQKACEIVFYSTGRTLSVKCFVTSLENKTKTEICLDAINEAENDQDDVVLVLIKFHNAPDVRSNFTTVNTKVDEQFLETLICCECRKYILPPIYVRELPSMPVTSVYCVDCITRKMNNDCDPKFVRECVLEELANLLKYPCKYRKTGCLFTSKPCEMKTHLESCLYKSQACPVSEYHLCSWKGLGVDMPAHVSRTHNSLMIDSSIITANVSKLKCYFLKFSDLLFRVVFAKENDCLIWDVQMIGSLKEGYMFELELIDSQNKDSSWIIKKPCKSLGSKQDPFDQKRCYLRQDQIENFIVKDSPTQKITFRIDIYKQAASSSSN